ncbi:hypothetical protein [Streptomyces sp. NPDC046197]|uniref:hypothetical protein n=1 Tax=Streptomyces sp. NPDC046197 TaxID=3154337 RepID=UPI003407E8F0
MVLGSDRRRDPARRGNGPAAVRRTALAATLAVVLVPALTGCSDKSGGGSDSTPPTPTVERTTTVPASPAATGPADPAAATNEIKRNWQRFFDPAISTKDKQAVLENGDAMAPVLRAFGGDQRGGQVQAHVTKVEFSSPTDADVTYTLTLKGATALPDAKGTAVAQNGTWKVSDKTLCALVQLSGNASASALPGC